ncbi:hypothetical protein EDB82DRAFT_478827 [Fusarium venenatum]|uniref:uncharacterized protein n=1 Tax=Fusarium venenatum TaxID=56646 RepID=UPI001DEAE850|nr:hypothetical protein EDB82DRAFT_478827 [Fusarium venenatum]
MGWACMGTLETVGRNSGQDDGLQTHQGAHGNVIELTKQNLAVHKLNVVVRMNRKQFVSLDCTGRAAGSGSVFKPGVLALVAGFGFGGCFLATCFVLAGCLLTAFVKFFFLVLENISSASAGE